MMTYIWSRRDKTKASNMLKQKFSSCVTKPGEVTKLSHFNPYTCGNQATRSSSTNPITNKLHPIRLHLAPIHYHSAFPAYFRPTSGHALRGLQLARNTYSGGSNKPDIQHSKTIIIKSIVSQRSFIQPNPYANCN